MPHAFAIIKNARKARKKLGTRSHEEPNPEVWGAFAEIVVAIKLKGKLHSGALTSKGTSAHGYDVLVGKQRTEVKSSRRSKGPIGDLRGKVCDDVAFVETRWNAQAGAMEATAIYVRTFVGLAKHPGMTIFKNGTDPIKLSPPIRLVL
jgi:hypothetical protein